MKLRFASLLCVLAAIGWAATHTSALSADRTTKLMFGLWKTRELAITGALAWLAVAFALASVSNKALLRFAISNASFAFAWISIELAGITGAVDYRAMLNPIAEGHLGTEPIPFADVQGTTREDLASAWGQPSPDIEFRFIADRRGYRNEPDREEASIYCLGDSFLVAGLVPWEDTVTAQLEKRTDNAVVALALNGLSPQEECDLFRESQLSANSKLVIQFLFEGNDLLDSAAYGAEASEDSTSLKDRTLANNLILKLQDATQPVDEFLALRSGQYEGETFLFRWTRTAFAGYEAESRRILDSLAKFKSEVEAAGGTYAVVMIPSKIRVLGPHCKFTPDSPLADWQSHCSAWPTAVSAWCKAQEVAYLDLSPALQQAMQRGDMPWFNGDTHWNATGNQIAADAVANWEFVRTWNRNANEDQP